MTALVAVGDHDHAAFRHLYELSVAKLFGICLRICGERRAAEDVVQDVYLTVWRRAGSYDPARAAPLTWLGTIARNRAIDWRRSHRPGAAVPVESIAEPRDPAVPADEALVQAEGDHRLHQCLDTLVERQRTVIRAAFFGGLTYAELALREDVPLGTMKSWVRRGLLRLRECLDAGA